MVSGIAMANTKLNKIMRYTFLLLMITDYMVLVGPKA